MINVLSTQSRECLRLAKDEAITMGHQTLRACHILLGIMMEGKNKGSIILDCFDIYPFKTRKEVESQIGKLGIFVDENLGFSNDVQMLIEEAGKIAEGQGFEEIRPEHLLHGILHLEECSAFLVLKGLGIDAEIMEREILGL